MDLELLNEVKKLFPEVSIKLGYTSTVSVSDITIFETKGPESITIIAAYCMGLIHSNTIINERK